MASSQIQIMIHGRDYTPLIPYETVHVDENIIMTSDTMEFSISADPDVDQVFDTKSGKWIPFKRPQCGEEIIWQNPNVMVAVSWGQTPYREFGGVVTEVNEVIDGPNLIYSIHCNSYVHWLDRHLVTGWYEQDAPENIIKKIVQTYAPSFSTDNVQSTNTQVVPQYFDYRQFSDALKSIADQLEYGLYVDHYKSVHFYAAETFTSPLPNNVLDAERDVLNYGDLELQENASQQYNKIFIKGFKTRSPDFVVMTFTADGTTNQWSTGYRVSSVKGDISVQVYQTYADFQADTAFQNGNNPTGGVAMTMKKDIVDGAPNQGTASNNAYIHFTQHLLRIPNYNGNGVIPKDMVVAIRFHYMKDMVFLAQDPSAQSTTANIEGTDGVYEYVHSDKSLTNSTMDAVKAKGQLLLMKYKFPQINGSFNTYYNATNKVGWRAGQYFVLKSQRRFGGIDEVFFVQRINKSIVKNDDGGLVTLYNVQFADSQYLV